MLSLARSTESLITNQKFVLDRRSFLRALFAFICEYQPRHQVGMYRFHFRHSAGPARDAAAQSLASGGLYLHVFSEWRSPLHYRARRNQEGRARGARLPCERDGGYGPGTASAGER